MNKLDRQMQRLTPDRAAIQKQIEDWAEPAKSMALILADGYTQKACADRFEVSLSAVRGVAMVVGWHPRWRRSRAGLTYKNRQTKLSWEEIAAEYKGGKTLEQVGEMAGVTRERIRQILYYQGIVPMRDMVPARKIERLQRIRHDQALRSAARTQEKTALIENKYAPWRQMWAEGLTLAEMGERVKKKPSAVAATIHHLRERTDWFPYRLFKS